MAYIRKERIPAEASPKEYLTRSATGYTFGTGWGSGMDTGTKTIRDGFAVAVDVDIPVRNDDNISWGGGYFGLYISVNGGSWQDTGHSGYHLAMILAGTGIMGYSKSIYFLRGTYGIPSSGDFTFRAAQRFRSYNGTLKVQVSSGTSGSNFVNQTVIREVNL